MDEQHGSDEAGGRWSQIDIGEVTFDAGTPFEDRLRVFLWRRIPTPVPTRLTEADYQLRVVVDWESEQFTFDPDQAERLADELPALLRAAAARSRQG